MYIYITSSKLQGNNVAICCQMHGVSATLDACQDMFYQQKKKVYITYTTEMISKAVTQSLSLATPHLFPPRNPERPRPRRRVLAFPKDATDIKFAPVRGDKGESRLEESRANSRSTERVGWTRRFGIGIESTSTATHGGAHWEADIGV